MMRITGEISISELVRILPHSVSYLMNKGIKCIACGEPLWGSLKESALEKGFNQEELSEIVKELNEMYSIKD